jgi:hypothetical protein
LGRNRWREHAADARLADVRDTVAVEILKLTAKDLAVVDDAVGVAVGVIFKDVAR